jgi:hypothetical protein
MAKNKKTKTPFVSKTQKAITIRKPSTELIFAGANPFASENAKTNKERQLISMTAEVFKVSPLGVNILGNLPYINKLGRKQKLAKYEPHAQIKLNWVQRSLTDTDKAVCEAILIRGGKEIPPAITGECSPSTIKMGTLKGYQNHIAETRAINRLIEFHFGVKIHEEMMSEIAKKLQKGDDPETLSKVAHANQTSAEEVGHTENKKKVEPIVGNKPSDQVKIAVEFIAKTTDPATLRGALKKIEDNADFTDGNKVYLCNLVKRKIKSL